MGAVLFAAGAWFMGMLLPYRVTNYALLVLLLGAVAQIGYDMRRRA